MAVSVPAHMIRVLLSLFLVLGLCPAQRPTRHLTAAARFVPEQAKAGDRVLLEVKAEPRTTGKTPSAMMVAEATRLRAALPGRCRRVVLDEHGADLTTQDLAQRLEKWLAGGDDVVICIGGPDGLDPGFKQEAAETLRLSSLTLPHALARLILCEQLYRAISIVRKHPYHREG